MISTQAFYSIYLLLSLGLLVQFLPPFGRAFLKLSGPYWLTALLLLTVSTLGFLLTPHLPPVFLTVANSTYVASSLMLIMMAINIRRPLRGRDIGWKFGLGMTVWAILFELLREQGAPTFAWRVLVVAGSTAAAFIAYSAITYKQVGSEKSPQHSIAVGCGLVCAGALLLRAWLVFTNEANILNIYDEPAMTSIIRTLSTACHFCMFLMINNSFTTTLATIKEVENQNLIYALELANKTAATGALSAAIAHELNQPLGSMRLNAQLLGELLSRKDNDNPLIKDLLDDVIKDNRHAANIITGLRAIFSTEESAFEAQDINESIRMVCEISGLQTKRLGITITLDLVPRATAYLHQHEFQQVILNLVNNAINALTGIEKVRKEIRIQTRLHENTVSVSVADNGPGIPDNLKPIIFDLLRSNNSEGMGLGLWLSKHIVERNNGTLKCENLPAGGARFIVEFPARAL